MWFGTIDGLNCYDGCNMTVWRDSTMKSLGQVIYAVEEDANDCLWIGSDLGLAIFDLKKETFLPNPFDDHIHIKSPVSDILFDNSGKVWLSTGGQGMVAYDPASGKTDHYVAPGRINSDIIIHIMQDSQGTIWAVSRDGGLSRFDKGGNLFSPVKDSPQGTVSIYEDKKHRIWVGTETGLFLFDPESKRWIHKIHPTDDHIFQVRQIVEPETDILLLASDEGLTRYDINADRSTTYKTGTDSPYNLNDNYLHSLFIDKENGLWIGTYFGGVNYLPPTLPLFSHYSNRNSGLDARIVSAFAKADGNKIWIGSDDNGFFLWDRDNDSFRSFSPSTGSGSAYYNTHALLQADGKLFVGMYMGGLDILDLTTYKFKNYKGGNHPNSLYSSSVYALFKDSGGNIWIGTPRGLNRYRPESDDFERIFDVNHADVECIFEDNNRHLYACSLNKGVFRLDLESGKWIQYSAVSDKNNKDCGLPTDKIMTGAQDSKGIIWFGTDGMGLLRFNPDSGIFFREEIPAEIRVIHKIIPAGNQLWLTTSNGLYCYTPDSGKIQSFNKASGLQDNLFMPNAGIMLDSGEIIAGGVNGFNLFKPSDFKVKTNDPDVILSELRIFNRRTPVDEDGSPLETALAYSSGLTLQHNHSIFEIAVSVVSYANPDQNNFIYKLEGFDPEWNMGPADGRISYTNLPYGNYKLLVRAADGAGGWNENSLSFPIKVLPPWWFSLPMLFLYFALFCIAVFLLYLRMKRKQKEQMQLALAKKDRELYQSKIDFFTHMVHEIRTPLTLILTPLENVMHSQKTIQEELPVLSIISRNGHRLLDIVNKLMDFRKMEAGSLELDLQPTELGNMMNDIYHNFLPMAESKGISVAYNPPASPCLAIADKDAVRHVVDNLLSNALKFTGSHIWIDIADDDNEHFYRITVRDNGIGIEKEDQEKIFSPFYQTASSKSADIAGTGIGLQLVKKYVDLMHGRIQLDSTPGLGSSFSVYLPKAKSESPLLAVESQEKRVVAEDESQESDGNKSGTILIAEDHPELLHFLRNLFEVDYNVVCAQNGKIALDLLKGHSFDLILSDVMMPEMNGIDLCSKVKGDIATSHIPVVLLTAKIENRDVVMGYEKGADLYVSKPFSSEVLKAQINGIIRNRKNLKRDFVRRPDLGSQELVPNSQLDKDFLQKVDKIVKERLADPEFSVDILAREVGVSRTGLFAKLKAVAGITPNAYIKRIRLNEAARLIAEEGAKVSEACYRVGFESRSHFTRYFQEQFGMKPSDYRTPK